MVAVPVPSGDRVRPRPLPGNRTIAVRQSNLTGEALEGLGRTATQAADEFDRIEAMHDEAGATELVNRYEEYSRARLHTDDDAYYNLRGMEAGRERGTRSETLRAYGDELLAEAPTDRMRNMARRQIDRLYGRDEQQIATYSNREMHQARENQSAVRIDHAQQSYVDATRLGDAAAMNSAMMAGLSEMSVTARRNGWSAEQTQGAAEAFVSGTHVAVVNDMVANGNPMAALEYLDENAGDILPDQESQIRNSLGPAVDRAFAQSRVEELMGTESAEPVAPVETGERREITFATPLAGRGRVTDDWGAARPYGGHTGIDYAAATGTPVNPTADGVVTFAGQRGGYGNQVEVDHGGGWTSRYSHLHDIQVAEGQRVELSAVLGGVGSTGRSSGPHLHYELLYNGRKVNPNEVGMVTAGGITSGATGGGEGSRYSTAAVRAAVDRDIAANNYSERRAQAMRDAADRYVSNQRGMRAQSEDEAYRAALDRINSLGHRSLTDPSQIDPLTWQAMGPGHRSTLIGRMERNRADSQDERSSQALWNLHLQSIMSPEGIDEIDLRELADDLNGSDMRQAVELVARAGQRDDVTASNIRSVIVRNATSLGINSGPNASEVDQLQLGMIAQMMNEHLSHLTGGERQPRLEEINSAFDAATLAWRMRSETLSTFRRGRERTQRTRENLQQSRVREQLQDAYGY